MKQAQLALLPSESITAIAAYLSDDDLPSLRLTCKTLAEKSKFTVAKRSFNCISITLDQKSFQKLRGLAADPFYAKFVKHVSITALAGHCYYSVPVATSGTLAAMFNRLVKLSLLTIQDDPFQQCGTFCAFGGNEYIKPWPWARKIRLIQMSKQSRGPGNEERQGHGENSKWTYRHRIFNIILSAIAEAQLANRDIRLGLSIGNQCLGQNQPHSLEFNGTRWQYCASILHHFSASVDINHPSSRSFFQGINPQSLSLDFGHLPSDLPCFIAGLGYYPKLSVLILSNLCIHCKQLDEFLQSCASTLESIFFKSVFLNDILGWMTVWKTLLSLPRLHKLGTKNLGIVGGRIVDLRSYDFLLDGLATCRSSQGFPEIHEWLDNGIVRCKCYTME